MCLCLDDMDGRVRIGQRELGSLDGLELNFGGFKSDRMGIGEWGRVRSNDGSSIRDGLGGFDGLDFNFRGFESNGVSVGQRSSIWCGEWSSVGDGLGCFNCFDFDFRGLESDGGSVRDDRGSNGVAHSDRGGNVLDDGSDGGISVSLNSRIGKVATETVRADYGAIVSRCAYQSSGRKRCWKTEMNDASVHGSKADQKDGELQQNSKNSAPAYVACYG